MNLCFHFLIVRILSFSPTTMLNVVPLNFFKVNNNIYLILFKLPLIGFCTFLKSKNQLHLLLKHQKKLRMLYQFESFCILKKAKEKK